MNNFWSAQRLLVIMPHADDEAYGCAGTIAKTKAAGGEVYIIIASIGELRHYAEGRPIVTGETRAAELAASMRRLGVDGYEVLYTDSESHLRLDAIPQRDLIDKIERGATYAIDAVRPTTLILPEPSFNQDHVADLHRRVYRVPAAPATPQDVYRFGADMRRPAARLARDPVPA